MTEDEAKKAVAEWRTVKYWMEQAKERERALRDQLAAHFFADKMQNGVLPKGTHKTEALGFKVKVAAKINYTVLEELEAATLAEAQLGPEGYGLIKRTPELSVSTYNKLPEAKKLIIDKMIVAKPGASELTIEDVPVPA